VSATAAATLTEPELVDALGAAVAPDPPAPLVAAAPFAKLRSFASWPSRLLPAESGAPFAPAVALEVACDGPVAANVTAPADVSERSVVASAVWSAKVSARAAPIETEPAAAPLAVAVAVAFVVAVYDALPTFVVGPPSDRAVLRTLLIAMATAGTIETPGPDAPAFACAVALLVPLALSATSSAPVRVAPRSSVAPVVTFVMLRATDAPIPALVPPEPIAAVAVATVVDAAVAVLVTSPPPAFAEPAIALVVSIFAIVSASDPATLTEPPPAPLVACEVMSLLPVVRASRTRPTELVVPATVDVFVTLASVIATAAPTFAVPPPTAEPFATDEASALASDRSVRRPADDTLAPLWTLATLEVFATVIATAAATLTGAALVEADGVPPAELVSAPPFAEDVVLAKPR
jgi:hypothetical protein